MSLAMVCLLAICINTVASLDFDQPGAYVAMELIKRLGMFFLLAGGAILAGLRSFNDTRADNRSAPVLLWALGIALGMFLLHNLIDFSLFETGPLFLFALLAGAALGGRVPVATSTTRAAEQGHTHGPGRAGRKIAVGCLAGAILGWLLVARAFVLPVLLAESSAAAAEENLRRGQFPEAVAAFEQAAQTVPYQGEYWYRAARAAIPPRAPHERVRGLIHRAIAADPGNVEYRLLSANYELAQPIVNVPRVRDDFERALRLDPNNVALRLRYAEALRRVGEVAEARHQFEEALRYNDLLPPDEPKRLSPTRVQEIRAQAER